MSAQIIPFPVEKRATLRLVDPRESWIDREVRVLSGPFCGYAGVVSRLSPTDLDAVYVKLDHEQRWFMAQERKFALSNLMLEVGEPA